MSAKLFLLKDDRWIEMGFTETPIITSLNKKSEDKTPFGATLSFTCTLTKRCRSRLFGKRRKYTYRTIRK